MELTVNRQTVKKVTLNRQLNWTQLAVKYVKVLLRRKSVFLVLCRFQFYIWQNAPCQLLRLNFKNKSDFCNYDFSFKLSDISRFCFSRVALRELDRERK